MNTDLILLTVQEALANHEPFQYACDDVFEGYTLPLVSVEVQSLTRHYHESFWGDDRDHGIAPLLCVDIEFVINKGDRVDNEEVVKVIAQAFEEQKGVRLFNCSIEHRMVTRLHKGKVITRKNHPEFKIRASQDVRLLDLDLKVKG